MFRGDRGHCPVGMNRSLRLIATCAVLSGCSSSPDVLYVGAPPPAPFDAACAPDAAFQNLDPVGGKFFVDSVPNPSTFVQDLTRQVCALLYRAPSEVPAVAKVTITIDFLTMDSYVTGTTTYFNTLFIQNYLATHSASDTRYELIGILVHYLSHMYQHTNAPIEIISGMNDFVRYRTGYMRQTTRQKGGMWTDGFHTTGFFFDYIERQSPGFVYELNQRIATGYDVSIFQALTGKDVLTLWNEYQASL